jgi:hypothetical protein
VGDALTPVEYSEQRMQQTEERRANPDFWINRYRTALFGNISEDYASVTNYWRVDAAENAFPGVLGNIRDLINIDYFNKESNSFNVRLSFDSFVFWMLASVEYGPTSGFVGGASSYSLDDNPMMRSTPPIMTQRGVELAKVRHFRNILSEIAMDILMSPPLLQLFGIDGIEAYTPGQYTYKGLPCYPDLDLPSHPYYPDDEYAMPPAFYMWDMYQDANAAVTSSVLQQVYEVAEKAITGPYDMMKQMQKEGIQPPFNPNAEGDMGLTPQNGTAGHQGSPQIEGRRLVWHPEGSDMVDFVRNDEVVESKSSSSGSTSAPAPAAPAVPFDDWEAEADRRTEEVRTQSSIQPGGVEAAGEVGTPSSDGSSLDSSDFRFVR